MLAIAANGAVLPTMIIFKGKRALKNIKVPEGCIVAVQKAWCDEAIRRATGATVDVDHLEYCAAAS